MTGTEKQIEWAESILERIKLIMEDAEKENIDMPGIEKVKEMHAEMMKNMNNAYAGHIIDDFYNVHRWVRAYDKAPDTFENYKNFRSQFDFVNSFEERNYLA